MPHNRKIISMESYVCRKASEKGFREWRTLFKTFDRFNEKTKWSDLPDHIFLFLCEESRESELTVYDLVMGATGRGHLCGCSLKSLPAETLSSLMDIYFFLIDQIRFECMRRIGWVFDIPFSEKSIIEVIVDLNRRPYPSLMPEPVLTNDHPGYNEDMKSNGLEHSKLVRKYIPEAVETFRQEIKRSKENGCS